MYKIASVEIDGFWGVHKVFSEFNEKVNIIIGRNGTGKTTFMNILYAILAVDVDELFDSNFQKAIIILKRGKNTKKVTVAKINDLPRGAIAIEYKISQKKFTLAYPNFPAALAHQRNRLIAKFSQDILNEMSKYVSLASLSVYRLRNITSLEKQERLQRKQISPVDERLEELMKKLTQYQLELSSKARSISAKLQKDILISILYSKTSGLPKLKHDVAEEKKSLKTAYERLGIKEQEISKKIDLHIDEASRASNKVANNKIPYDDAVILEAYRKTSKIVELSLKAEEEIDYAFSQINLFLRELGGFVENKKFEISNGGLKITGTVGEISPFKLSSGEKQLFILLTESLLQEKQPCIYMADEPELSLHISWQRKIISSIREINPESQIIVATHSPEVASGYRDELIDMKDIRYDGV